MNTAEMFVSGLDVKKDLDTSKICSFRAGGKISVAVYPKTPGDLRLLVSDTPYAILGGMTDVAVSDDGYDGTVVFSSALRGVEVDGDYAYIGSGERDSPRSPPPSRHSGIRDWKISSVSPAPSAERLS